MIKIKLKDESVLEVEENLSVLEIAKKISEGLARVATAAEIDGEVVDLRTIVNNIKPQSTGYKLDTMTMEHNNSSIFTGNIEDLICNLESSLHLLQNLAHTHKGKETCVVEGKEAENLKT